jgi:hypothetical protein
MKPRRKRRLAIRLRGQRPAKPNSIENVREDRKTEDTRSPRRNPNSPDLPPNENLQKDPDETYGDTEMPERCEDI